jgi:hypothetical protein
MGRADRKFRFGSPGVILTIVFAALLTLVTRVEAFVTVEYHSDTGARNVVGSTGLPLTDGSEVRVGYFQDGFDPRKEGSNLTALGNAWRELSRTAVRTLFGQGGRYYGIKTYSNADFAGKTVFLWILKTRLNEPVAPDYGNVTEYGIFSLNSGWKLPGPETPPPANHMILSSSAVDLAIVGTMNRDSLVLAAAVITGSDLALADWRQSAFSASTNEALKADMADPDGDGIPNVLEYFLGSNPEQRDGKAIACSKQVIDNVPYLCMTFTQAKNRPGVIAMELSSVDMFQWNIEGIKQEILAEDAQSMTLRFLVPMDGPQRYLQLILKTKQ